MTHEKHLKQSETATSRGIETDSKRPVKAEQRDAEKARVPHFSPMDAERIRLEAAKHVARK